MPGVPSRVTYEDFVARAPAVAAALRELSKTAGEAGLDKRLVELIKVRASQINGCAFCVQFHINLARKLGVPVAKLDLVAVWREAGVFDARESAALAWTETLTRLGPGIGLRRRLRRAPGRVQRGRSAVPHGGDRRHQPMEPHRRRAALRAACGRVNRRADFVPGLAALSWRQAALHAREFVDG
jgi:AhpD family alkylhydroperoxidase